MIRLRVSQLTAIIPLSLLLAVICSADIFAMAVSPLIAGNGPADSICVTVVSIDTTLYPEVTNLDSLDILRYGPDGSMVDSTSEDAPNVANISEGFYRAVFRASDSEGTKGAYTVVAKGWLAGKARGIASVAYEVIESGIDEMLATVSSIDARADSIKDTVDNYLPVGGGEADTAAIARSVWDDDLVALSGRRVGFADTAGTVMSIPSAGSGAYACSLYYFDTADTSAIQGVASRAMNSTQTATSGFGMSNPDGLVVLSLDAGIYRVWSYKVGYSFSPLPDSVVVSNPAVVDTVWGDFFSPGDPPLPMLCRVFGWVTDLSGAGISGATVAACIEESPLRFGSMIISPYFRSTVTDTGGYWFLDLMPSYDLEPPTTSYTFSVYYQTGAIAVRKARVPDTTAWNLSW